MARRYSGLHPANILVHNQVLEAENTPGNPAHHLEITHRRFYNKQDFLSMGISLSRY